MTVDKSGVLLVILISLSFIPLTAAAARRLTDSGTNPLKIMLPISVIFAIAIMVVAGRPSAHTMLSELYLVPMFVFGAAIAIGYAFAGLSGAFGIFTHIGDAIGQLLLPSISHPLDANPNEVPS